MIVKIIENSWIARIAASRLKAGNLAMVIGRTIYLYNISRPEFLKNTKWVRHEVAHVIQYEQLGKMRFIALYFLESFNKGYQNNFFEVEARKKENDATILKGLEFI